LVRNANENAEPLATAPLASARTVKLQPGCFSPNVLDVSNQLSCVITRISATPWPWFRLSVRPRLIVEEVFKALQTAILAAEHEKLRRSIPGVRQLLESCGSVAKEMLPRSTVHCLLKAQRLPRSLFRQRSRRTSRLCGRVCGCHLVRRRHAQPLGAHEPFTSLGAKPRTKCMCSVPCDYIPARSYVLFLARQALEELRGAGG